MTQPTLPVPVPEPQEDAEADDKNHNPYIIVAILALSIVVLLFYRLSGADIQNNEPQLTSYPERLHSGYIYVDVTGAVVRPGPYHLRVGSRVFDAIASAGGLKANADRDRINMAARLKDEMKLHVPAIGDPSGQVLETPAPPAESGTSVDSGQDAMGEPEPPEQGYQAPVEPPVLDEPTPAQPIAPPVAVAPSTPSPEPSATPKEPPVVAAAARVSINRADAAELERLPGIGPKLAQEIVDYRKGPPPRAFTSLQELANVPGIKENKLEEILPYVKL